MRLRRIEAIERLRAPLDQATIEEMLPVSIHERFGEVGIFRRSHPLGERFTRVFIQRDIRDGRAKAGGWLGSFGLFIGRFGFAALEPLEERRLTDLRALRVPREDIAGRRFHRAPLLRAFGHAAVALLEHLALERAPDRVLHFLLTRPGRCCPTRLCCSRRAA